SKHSGVIAAIGKHIVREGGIEETFGRILRALFEQRNDADYGEAIAAREDADRAIADAERFVTAVESWLAERQTRHDRAATRPHYDHVREKPHRCRCPRIPTWTALRL